jgi:hypothetical protein
MDMASLRKLLFLHVMETGLHHSNYSHYADHVLCWYPDGQDRVKIKAKNNPYSQPFLQSRAFVSI